MLCEFFRRLTTYLDLVYISGNTGSVAFFRTFWSCEATYTRQEDLLLVSFVVDACGLMLKNKMGLRWTSGLVFVSFSNRRVLCYPPAPRLYTFS